MGQSDFTVAPCTATSDRTPCHSEPYMLQDCWCTWCNIKEAVFKRPHVSASSYVALTEPLVARDQKSTNVDCLVLEQQSRRLPYALYALFVSSINAKINVNPLMWLLFKHPFGLTFLSSPSSLRGVRQKLNFQLLPAFPSCLTDCVYQKVQPGMLGTREPVTPCLVAQNPPRLPPLEAALGCAWKQASPIISYKILERAPKLARKMEVSYNNVV